MPVSSIGSPPALSRRVTVAAVALMTIVASGVYMQVTKNTGTDAIRSQTVAKFGSSSGSYVQVDGFGNLTGSGYLAMKNGGMLSCGTVRTTSTGMLVCGTSASALTFSTAEGIYVNQAGDTMTGTLVVSGSKDVQVGRTVSGSHIHAVNNVSASGNVVTELALSGAYVHAKRCPIEMSVANVTASGTAITTGTGKVVIPIPWSMSGYSLSQFEASVGVKGTTGLQRMSLQNATKGARQIFSTNPSIDTAETSTRTAATAYVIDTAADDVSGGDRISFSVLQVHSGTAAKGLDLLLTFSCP